MWACLANSAGGGKLRCSLRMESMLGESTTALSAISEPRRRGMFSHACEDGAKFAEVYSTHPAAGCDRDHISKKGLAAEGTEEQTRSPREVYWSRNRSRVADVGRGQAS